MSIDTILPKGSTILVTGVTGFIGSHIVTVLLDLGYTIRGTARDDEKARWITEYFHSRYPPNHFSVTVIPDQSASNAYTNAMEGVDGVLHVATEHSMSPDPNQVITPVVSWVKNIMSAAAARPRIKRFVLTSSSAAVASPVADTKRHLDKNNWNDGIIDEAFSGPDSPGKSFLVYMASKCAAERAAWKYMADNKPGYALNTVIPDMVIGPKLLAQQSASTAGLTQALYAGDEQTAGFMASAFVPRKQVNVRDVARLHVAALLLPDVLNERLLAYNEPVAYNELVEAFMQVSPGWNKLPVIENAWKDLSTIDCGRSPELLKRMGRDGWIGLEESVRECVVEGQ